MSPTARSLRLLRTHGWLPWVVERKIGQLSRDLFNFADLLAIKGGESLLVQVTSGSNFKTRLDKVLEAEHLDACLEAGFRVQVHGWRKLKRTNQWENRCVEILAGIPGSADPYRLLIHEQGFPEGY